MGKINKTKILAVLIASFAVFFATYFALAENKNTSNIFLDSDQDGLTDQEECMLGTDPYNPDTDGDGYSDGKEVRSGYNPLKPAPGDALMPVSSADKPAPMTNKSAPQSSADSGSATSTSPGDALLGSTDNLLGTQSTSADLSSDPNNLTGQMVNNFLQLTLNKSQTDDSFTDNPSFSEDDLNQIVQNSLATTDIAKDLPGISDSDIKILPAVDDSKLTADEVKAEQKQQIQTYLASLAFVAASNSPFPTENTSDVSSSLSRESDNLIAALSSGDQTKINDYAQRAQTALDQVKKIEVPYVLKDFHKSVLQLATYSLSFKDGVAAAGSDPMKSLASLSSLQSVGDQILKLQGELTNVLNEYGIEFIEPAK